MTDPRARAASRVLLGVVALLTAFIAVRHYDSHDFIYSVWTPTRALQAGVNPYDPTNVEYFTRYPVPTVAGLYVPTALLLHAPLAFLSASRAADVMAGLNAALLWLGVLLLIPPRTARSCVIAALAGTAVIGSAAADHTIELGQLSGWAFAGLALFVFSLRHDSSARWLPAIGAVLVSLKPQSGIPFLLALSVLGCWPVVKRAAAILAVTSLPGAALFLQLAGDPAEVFRIVASNAQHMLRLPQGNLAVPHNLRIDALGVVSHLGGPALAGLGWAALTLLVSTVAFAIAIHVERLKRPLAPTDPYVVTLITLFVTLSMYHLTYDQLLLYVGPLTALAVLIARQAPSSARLFAVSAVALFGAGLISRTAFRDQFVALGVSAPLVHKAWVAAPTLICLVCVASMARGRREMHPGVMDGSAAARV